MVLLLVLLMCNALRQSSSSSIMSPNSLLMIGESDNTSLAVLPQPHPLTQFPKPTQPPQPPQPPQLPVYQTWPINLVNLTEERLEIPGRLNIICRDVLEKKMHSVVDLLSFQKLIDNDTSRKLGYCEFPVNPLDLIELNPGEAARYVDLLTAKGNSDVLWFCDMEANDFCNGRSDCLTDECHCISNTTEIFYCPDKRGCITFPQLCDGFSDCPDGSDECLCEGFVKKDCPTINSSVCLSEDRYCKMKQALSDASVTCNLPTGEHMNCSGSKKESRLIGNPLLECMKKHDWSTDSTNLKLHYLCKTNCSDVSHFVEDKWDHFCDNITLMNEGMRTISKFLCNYRNEKCEIEQLCDGTTDCSNGADEIKCPGRFYCYLNTMNSKRMEWVAKDKRCDGVKDCSNGRDECDACDSGGSSSYLIRSNILFYFTVTTGIATVIINSIVCIKCSKKSPSTSAGKVDRFLCIQVLFFDWMMGLYNCGIVVATLILQSRGSYCPQDEQWRSSILCQVLGMIFSIASHGSLSAIALMSVVRCINCVKIQAQFKLRTIVITSTILITINVVNALIPLLPFAAVQDIFRTEAFYKNFVDNPFMNSNLVNVARLNDMHKIYYSSETDIYKTIKNLNNITSNDTLFDIIEVGYYGNTPLCVHNVFKNQKSYLIYKLFYLAVLSLLLFIVTFTYVVIVRKHLLSQRKVGSIGNGTNRQNAGAPSLAVKVSLMIGTQLASWLTYIGLAVFFHVSNKNPSEEIFEVLALIALPINSLLNPIFYSELYKRINTIASFQLRRLSRVLTKRLRRKNTDSIELGEC